MSRKLLLLCIVASASLWAQKKPVTIEMLATQPPARARSGPVVWSHDGKSFAFQEGNKLWRYDVASRQQKELADLTKLVHQAVDGAEPKAFGWRNRNVEEQAFQWSRSGREMLISAGGDLFLAHLDSGAMEQLTATPERESDPKLSPDGRYVSFRRNNDLYCLDIAATQVRRLTADGSPTLLNGGLDWVYPEELELATASRC
ncbi:MAG: DPP IV N-terminal domain-containing protein, partial [Acidobacteria bacterium]|nr:DPP IV N-terminal domain-containing protein [Acidobacteriota bacterium]